MNTPIADELKTRFVPMKYKSLQSILKGTRGSKRAAMIDLMTEWLGLGKIVWSYVHDGTRGYKLIS